MVDAKYVDPVTDDHLRGIGRVITRWARAERAVMDSLWEVATGHSFATPGKEAAMSLALVTGMDTRVALGILKAVFNEQHPASVPALDKLVESLNKLFKVRNVIAHGRWHAGKRPNSIETITFTSSGRLKTEPHAFTPAELDSAANRIFDCTQHLVALLQTHGHWKPPPRLETHHELDGELHGPKLVYNRQKRDPAPIVRKPKPPL